MTVAAGVQHLSAGRLGIRIEELERTGYHQVASRPRATEMQPFATPTGKIELFSTVLDGLAFGPLLAAEQGYVGSLERLFHMSFGEALQNAQPRGFAHAYAQAAVAPKLLERFR